MPPARRFRNPGPAAPPPPVQIVAGRTWIHGRLESVEIGIDEDGWIRRVAKSLTGAPRRDFGEAVLLPSAVDLHVHFREPGGDPRVESVADGTIEAALGGVGLAADMPNTQPPTDAVDRLQARADRVRGRAAVDLLLYATPTRRGQIAALGRVAGAFKLFLGPTTGIETPPDPSELPELLRAAAETGLPLTVHAEDPGAFRPGPEPADPVDWDRLRPKAAEAQAIDRLRSAPAALRLHVAHITDPASIPRLAGQGVSFEATPHHLLLAATRGDGPQRKVNPPLRSPPDRSALHRAFREGRIPCLASDHAPHSVTEKERPFPLAPSGVPGVETMLPLFLEEVRRGDLDLGVLVRASMERPARWLGQPMGRIAPGHRAHLIVVDFRDRRTIAARRLHAPCGWTPFEGWPAIFPRIHLFDGRPIVDDGEYVGRAFGRVRRPEFAPDGGRTSS
ncbi:MAG: dihydroorotase [Thermoplasmata archaeon]